MPFAKDLYDEAVPEVSEYREFSVRGETFFEGTMRASNRNLLDAKASRRDSEKRSRLLDTFQSSENSIEDGSMAFYHRLSTNKKPSHKISKRQTHAGFLK